MAVVRVIPPANVAIMVAVCFTPFVSIGVSVTMVAVMPMVVVPIMAVVIVILGKNQCCRECQRKNRERTGAEKEPQ